MNIQLDEYLAIGNQVSMEISVAEGSENMNSKVEARD